MSEKQYCEFRAIDRPLSSQERHELRARSNRATLTAHSFVHTFDWGDWEDFKHDAKQLMERYFDALVYVSNWGTNRLMLRVPISVLPTAAVEPYAGHECLTAWTSGENLLLDFVIQDEGQHRARRRRSVDGRARGNPHRVAAR